MIRTKKLIAILTAAAMLTTVAIPVGATTSEQIESVKKEKANAESSLAEAQNRKSILEELKGNQEEYLTELNAQYEELTQSMIELSEKKDKKKAEYEELKAELKEVKRQEAEQYAAMKLRITYMYENSQESYMTLLFSAKSFSDFLNRAENIKQINEYDRNMLKEYQATQKKVAKKKTEVEKEQKAIEKLEQESKDKREEIAQIEEATRAEIAGYEAEIDSEASQVNSLLAKVNTQSEKLNTLVEEAEAAAAAEAKAEAEAEAAVAKATAEAKEAAEAEEAEANETEETAQESEAQEETPEEDSGATEKEAPSQDTGASSSEGTYLGNFKLTAYCNCAQCCGVAGNLTASGTVPTAGRTVAMAGVPFGTKLLINGNVYTVEDLGTAYGHVDIFFNSHSDALSFGLQYADVYQVD